MSELAPPSDSGAEATEAVIAAMVRFVREEIAPLLDSGTTWKVTINGGASAGDVRVVVEKHHVIGKKCFMLA